MTIMWDILKKKLRKKVVVAVAVPFTKQQFGSFFNRGDSDFICSLTHIFKTNDFESLWERYSKTASIIEKSLRKYKKRGAVIIEQLTTNNMDQIADADIAIVIAHHSDSKDEIELANSMVSSSDFVKAIPLEFKGLLDMSSCYSSTIQIPIKMRCPDCKILADKKKIPLLQLVIIYEYIIKSMCQQPDREYIDIVKSAYGIVMKIQSAPPHSTEQDIVYLGGPIQSSVFAPKQVKKGQPFMIQVAIHKKTDADIVEITAREADGSTSLRNPLRLSFKLKKNDLIDIALKISSTQKDDFKITRSRDFFYWDNEPRFSSFTVFVSEHCKSLSCLATIKICVNKLPVGNISFSSEVVENITQKDAAADLRFMAYDKPKEMSEAQEVMMHRLKKELEFLQQGTTIGNGTPSQRDIEICTNSIHLLERIDTFKKHNQVFRVFISSTSDLSSYRKVMENQVLECSMYPEMYEKWPQKDKYPRDYCIEKVLTSDIFVCILGPNYGYIEPNMGTSMTEIEFRVALLSGKPILVYVLDDYEEQMLAYLPEHQYEVNKQRDLINELDKKRMVEFFKDEFALSLISCRELTLLQAELQHQTN